MRWFNNKWWLAGLLSVVFPLYADSTTVEEIDITVTVNGRVVVGSCTPTFVSPTEIYLGNHYTYNMVTNGTGWQLITLGLGNCPIGTTYITATFSGLEATDPAYYKNEGTAENVIIELKEQVSGKNLNNGASIKTHIDNVKRYGVFILEVRALTKETSVTEGDIKSTITVTYSYE